MAVGLDLVDEHGALLAAVPVEVALPVAVDVEPADHAAARRPAASRCRCGRCCPARPTFFGKPTLTDSKLAIPPLLSLGSRSGSHARCLVAPANDPGRRTGARSGTGAAVASGPADPTYERIVGHAADLYHRIDIRQTSRHLVVRAGDRVVAETTQPFVLYESGFAPRWYVPREDVDAEALTPSGPRRSARTRGWPPTTTSTAPSRPRGRTRASPDMGRVGDLVSFEPDRSTSTWTASSSSSRGRPSSRTASTAASTPTRSCTATPRRPRPRHRCLPGPMPRPRSVWRIGTHRAENSPEGAETVGSPPGPRIVPPGRDRLEIDLPCS